MILTSVMMAEMEAAPRTPSAIMLRFAFLHLNMSQIAYLSISEIHLTCIREVSITLNKDMLLFFGAYV
jgi:hypothetical protein